MIALPGGAHIDEDGIPLLQPGIAGVVVDIGGAFGKGHNAPAGHIGPLLHKHLGDGTGGLHLGDAIVEDLGTDPLHHPVVHLAGFPEELLLLRILVGPLKVDGAVAQNVVCGGVKVPQGDEPLGGVLSVHGQGLIVDGVHGNGLAHIVSVGVEGHVHPLQGGVADDVIDQNFGLGLGHIEEGGPVASPGAHLGEVVDVDGVAHQHLLQPILGHVLAKARNTLLDHHRNTPPFHALDGYRIAQSMEKFKLVFAYSPALASAATSLR